MRFERFSPPNQGCIGLLIGRKANPIHPQTMRSKSKCKSVESPQIPTLRMIDPDDNVRAYGGISFIRALARPTRKKWGPGGQCQKRGRCNDSYVSRLYIPARQLTSDWRRRDAPREITAWDGDARYGARKGGGGCTDAPDNFRDSPPGDPPGLGEWPGGARLEYFGRSKIPQCALNFLIILFYCCAFEYSIVHRVPVVVDEKLAYPMQRRNDLDSKLWSIEYWKAPNKREQISPDIIFLTR